MGYQGSSASAEGSPSPRFKRGPVIVVIVAAVVLMLLIASLTVLFTSDLEPLDYEDESIEDGVIVIRGDVKWEDRTGYLDMPIRVMSGGNLTLEDCDLLVRLEDLVLSRDPWFDIHPDGRMNIVGSRVELHKDPRLDRSYTLGTERTYRGFQNVPFLHRAVNMEGATAPRMIFDARSTGEAVDVIVAYMSREDEELTFLEKVSIETGDLNWTRTSVGLEDLAGTLVMLYLIVPVEEDQVVHVSDLRVTDDGRPLPADLPMGGNPIDDHWGRQNGISTAYLWDEEAWPDLFLVMGELTASSSQLIAPSDINRTGFELDEGLEKIDIDASRDPYIIHDLERGGDISVPGGTLRLEGTDLDFISVNAVDGSVDAREVRIVGDRELVTMYGCSGSFIETEFMMEYDEWDTPSPWWPLSNPQWYGLAIWGRSEGGPVEVSRCEFQNMPLGLDMTHADVRLDGCSFVNASRMAIWNHNTTGTGGWSEINSTCDLTEARGYRYLETHNGHITFTGPGVGLNYSVYDFRNHGWLRGPSWRWDPPVGMIDVLLTEAILYVPTYSVDSRGTEYPLESIKVDIESTHAGAASMMLDTSLSEFLMEFPGPGDGTPPDGPVELDDMLMGVSSWTGLDANGTDGIDLAITVYLWNMMNDYRQPLASDLEVEFRLDEETTSVHPVPFVIGDDHFPDHEVNESFRSEPGYHTISVLLRGVAHGGSSPEVIDTVDLAFFRADGSAALEDLDPELLLDYLKVFVDPEVRMDVDISNMTETYDNWTSAGITLVLGEGSHVNVSGHVEGDGHTTFSVFAQGNGTLHLEDLEADYGTLSVVGCNMEMRNLTVPLYETGFYGVNGTIEGCDLEGSDYIGFSTSTLEIINSSFEVGQGSFHLERSNITFRGSTFKGGGRDQLRLYQYEPFNLTMEGCIFEDVVLGLTVHEDSQGHTRVVDCWFRGTPSGLTVYDPWLSNDPDEVMAMYENLTIEGNVFSGPGSTLKAHLLLHQEVAMGNALLDGAWRVVTYDLAVSLVASGTDEPGEYPTVDLVPQDGLELADVGWGYDDDYIVRVWVDLEDPSDLDSPRPAHIVLTMRDWYDGHAYAVAFSEVDLTAGWVELTYTSWGRSTSLVEDLLSRLEDMAWWDAV